MCAGFRPLFRFSSALSFILSIATSPVQGRKPESMPGYPPDLYARFSVLPSCCPPEPSCVILLIPNIPQVSHSVAASTLRYYLANVESTAKTRHSAATHTSGVRFQTTDSVLPLEASAVRPTRMGGAEDKLPPALCS